MRLPIQCEGIERGPERAVNMGVVGSVSPQFLGGLLGTIGSTLGPIALRALSGAVQGAVGG